VELYLKPPEHLHGIVLKHSISITSAPPIETSANNSWNALDIEKEHRIPSKSASTNKFLSHCEF